MLKFYWITVAVVALDQVTKLTAKYLVVHPIEVAPFLNLVLILNKGAAFGLSLGLPSDWQNFLFAIIALIVSFVIIAMVRRLGANDVQVLVGLMLVLGGAVGNFIDRFRLQGVVDFIDVYYRSWPWLDIPGLDMVYCHLPNSRGDWHVYANDVFHCHWPAFNVADSAITVGAILLVLDALGLGFRKRHRPATPPYV